VSKTVKHTVEKTSPAKTGNFRNIGLIGRPGKSSVVDTLHIIHDFIVKQGLNPIFDEGTAALAGLNAVQVITKPLLGEVCDLVIVVGGDGSLLHAARALARYQTPVLGINRGRLGFLTDVSPDEVLHKLDQVLKGEYTLDRRFLLHMEIRSGGRVTHEGVALNDIVLHAGKSVHMIDFELNIDGHFVYRQHSDGLIVATPTGSTAYSLSAGGPIMHPSMNGIVIAPMHPHTLSSRPIVVGSESEIKINIKDTRVHPMVSADGQTSVTLDEGDWLHIRKHPFKLCLIHPPGYDFYAACRTKLGWSHYQENKDEH
jgi:NAD+ kinase